MDHKIDNLEHMDYKINNSEHIEHMDYKINNSEYIEHMDHKIDNLDILRDDAKKYFNQAIITSREAMSLSTTNLDHYFYVYRYSLLVNYQLKIFKGQKYI